MSWIIAVILLFFVSPLHAASVMMMGGGATAAAACTSCTGGVIFAAYFSQDGDVTTGSPCGCSAGDTTGTAADSCTITGGYLYSADNGKYYAWDVSSDDIFNDQTGSILIEFRIVAETFTNGALLFDVTPQTNEDRVEIYTSGGDELSLVHEGANTPTTIATSGADNVLVNTQYYVVIRWTTANVDPNLKIEIYNGTTDALIDDASSNTNLTAFDTAAGAGHFKVGNNSAANTSINIYKIKVWDTYAGAPTSGFAAE